MIGVVIGALLVWPAPATAAPPHQPDFNGDGYADLAVGAPYANVGARDSGAVHVFYGSPGGLGVIDRQVWSQVSPGIFGKPRKGAQFGWSIAAGDFDGDGFSDVAVGARFDTREAWHAGVVYVIYGSPGGLSSTRGQRWSVPTSGSRPYQQVVHHPNVDQSAETPEGDSGQRQTRWLPRGRRRSRSM